MAVVFLFTATSALAQNSVLVLDVDPIVGSTDQDYTFRIDWFLGSYIPDYSDVELQYKRDFDTDWQIYSSTRGSPRLLTLETQQAGSDRIRKLFTFKPSNIPGVPTTLANPTFSATYDFRIVDKDLGFDPNSNVESITFNSACRRNVWTSLKLLEGSDYRRATDVNAQVDVGEGDRIGNIDLRYELSIINQDSGGCAGSSSFLVEVSGTGVEKDSDNHYEYRILSARLPDGSVINNPGNSISVDKDSRPTVLTIEVKANNEIRAGVNAYGIVNFKVTNLQAKNEGVTSSSDEAGRIDLRIKRDCKRENPTISYIPNTGRDGFPGDEVSFLVTIRNDNTGGCDPEEFRITRVGVQEIAGRDSRGGKLADPESWKWGFKARFATGGTVIEKGFRNTGQTSTFDVHGIDYVRFEPLSEIKFVLGNADDLEGGKCKNCLKTLILKVSSSVADQHYSHRSIGLCVNYRSYCGVAASYDLKNRYIGETIDTGTDAQNGITDDKLNTPEAVLRPPGTTTPRPTTGAPVTTAPSQIDAVWYENCRACTLRPEMGLNTDTNTCIRGGVSSSSDGKAKIGVNWIYFPIQKAVTNILPSADVARRSQSYSCEKPPTGVGKISTTPSAPSTSTPTTPSATTSSSSLPDGTVTIFGYNDVSDKDVKKLFTIQLFTNKPLSKDYLVSFDFLDLDGKWKPMGKTYKIGELSPPSSGDERTRAVIFAPSALGMRNEGVYKFRASVSTGTSVKVYEGQIFTFRASSSSTGSSGIPTASGSTGDTNLPDGTVTVFGYDDVSERNADKMFVLQIYTNTVLPSNYLVSFNFLDTDDKWKSLGNAYTVGELSPPASGDERTRSLVFIPKTAGMKNGESYKFRATVSGNSVIKIYEGQFFTFTA